MARETLSDKVADFLQLLYASVFLMARLLSIIRGLF